MKERIIYDDEFEKQLKEKADQFKMYPSDKVWNEVYSSLHTQRRRFVAGMTILIGSILMLAGAQLIFPPKNAAPKIIAAKLNKAGNPASGAGLHNFTNAFAIVSQDNANGQQNADNNLNATAPFVLRSALSSDQNASSDEMLVLQPEKMQALSHIKPIQAADLNVSEKSNALLVTPELVESAKPAAASLVNNSLSEDMISGKSVNQLTHIRNDRFRWEIYVAPTLNTHYLTGLNYQTMSQSMPNSPIMVVHFANVNGFVDNTPSMGYDVGGNILYRISKNISLKAGIDFSFNRYYIKVYNSNPSMASATLNTYLGYITDTTGNSNTATSSIDKNPEHYQNKYYQISLPVGVEMKIAGNSKLQFHMGATLQPSYLLNTDAYVLSNDYSSYIKNAQAFRRWNLIGGVDAYISYPMGKLRWELGPQVKYQIFSTYKNSYPLQENMLNYGIRIGISKSIR
jgi:hypothetical protein